MTEFDRQYTNNIGTRRPSRRRIESLLALAERLKLKIFVRSVAHTQTELVYNHLLPTDAMSITPAILLFLIKNQISYNIIYDFHS